MSLLIKEYKQYQELVKAYPHLLVGIPDSNHDHALAAKNIRRDLTLHFPNQKFVVRSYRFKINISWTLGPTKRAVKTITDKFTYEIPTFCELFGGTRYVFFERNTEIENAIIPIAKALCEHWNLPQPPDLKDYSSILRPDSKEDLHSIATSLLQADSFPANAVFTGIERLPTPRYQLTGWAARYKAAYSSQSHA